MKKVFCLFVFIFCVMTLTACNRAQSPYPRTFLYDNIVAHSGANNFEQKWNERKHLDGNDVIKTGLFTDIQISLINRYRKSRIGGEYLMTFFIEDGVDMIAVYAIDSYISFSKEFVVSVKSEIVSFIQLKESAVEELLKSGIEVPNSVEFNHLLCIKGFFDAEISKYMNINFYFPQKVEETTIYSKFSFVFQVR